MPFNSDTYHMNKQRRLAREYLAEARHFKALATTDDRPWWRDHYAFRASMLVRSARWAMQSFRFYRRMKRITNNNG
jgi:hypothetical protein